MALSPWPTKKRKPQPVELVWCTYDGYVAMWSAKSLGLSPLPHGNVEHWLPFSCIGHVTYVEGGDTLDYREGKIEAIEVAD